MAPCHGGPEALIAYVLGTWIIIVIIVSLISRLAWNIGVAVPNLLVRIARGSGSSTLRFRGLGGSDWCSRI